MLILMGLAILAAVVTGVIAFKFFEQRVELTERAGAEGGGVGMMVSIDECAEEGVQRSSTSRRLAGLPRRVPSTASRTTRCAVSR